LFKHLLTDKFKIKYYKLSDEYGRDSWEEGVKELTGRFDTNNSEVIRDDYGRDISYDCKLYIPGDLEITEKDLIVKEGRDYLILRISAFKGFKGVHHKTLYIKKK